MSQPSEMPAYDPSTTAFVVLPGGNVGPWTAGETFPAYMLVNPDEILRYFQSGVIDFAQPVAAPAEVPVEVATVADTAPVPATPALAEVPTSSMTKPSRSAKQD